MKKTLFLLILVIFFITIGQSKAHAALKVIKRGNLLIGNGTKFSNRAILNSFNHYWNSKSKLKKQEAEKLYMWVVDTGYTSITHPHGCLAYVSAASFFKPDIKYIIKRKRNGFYYAIVDNYKVNFFTKRYSVVKKMLEGKKWVKHSSPFYSLLRDHKPVKSCNYPSLHTRKVMDIILEPLLMKLRY